MASIEITIRDEQGNLINKKLYGELEIGRGSFHEIEGAVETFKQEALPEIEQALLEHQQHKFSKALKKGGLPARAVPGKSPCADSMARSASVCNAFLSRSLAARKATST